MRVQFPNVNRQQHGYALMMVLGFAALSLLVLGAAMNWVDSNARQTQRKNRYLATSAVGEGVADKVVAQIAGDFQTKGGAMAYLSPSGYGKLTTQVSEADLWRQFAVDDGQGNTNQVLVTRTTNWNYGLLNTKYSGLYGSNATYRLSAHISEVGQPANLAVSMQQDLQVASIPLFQFAIFYGMDLEINPPNNFTVNGRVHSNGAIYTKPPATTTFQTHVTAVGAIQLTNSPNDPVTRTLGRVVYQGEHDGGAKSLNVPIGATGDVNALQAMIDIPPVGESASSLVGQQRYYNKADLVILVNDNGVVATSGAYDGFNTTVPWVESKGIVNKDGSSLFGQGKSAKKNPYPFLSFADYREFAYVQSTDVDISVLLAQYSNLTAVLGREAKIIYIADLRYISGYQSVVRLLNGQTLPAHGLTIATSNPLYVQGHYNAPAANLGTTNTTTTVPASLIADAITILSGNWQDAHSAQTSWSYKKATSTTINAAIIAGIVPSSGYYYSGGVENFHRLLEDWTGKTLTHNGAIVALYPSRKAIGPWGNNSYIFQSPTARKFSRDPNFLDPTKLPPGTPEVRTIIRSKWITI